MQVLPLALHTTNYSKNTQVIPLALVGVAFMYWGIGGELGWF